MISKTTKRLARLAILVLVCACSIGLNRVMAQRDMILTQAGEQLRCRIIDETPVRFAFAYLKDGKPYRSEIFKNLVTSFKFNYYDADLPNADKLPEAMYRATNGVDSQSPRALSLPTNKPEKRSSKEKRKQKEGKEKLAGELTDIAADAKNSVTKEAAEVVEANTNVSSIARESGIKEKKVEPLTKTSPAIIKPEEKVLPQSTTAKTDQSQQTKTFKAEKPTVATSSTAPSSSTSIKKGADSMIITSKSGVDTSKEPAKANTNNFPATSKNRTPIAENPVNADESSSNPLEEKKVVAAEAKPQKNEVVNSASDIIDAELLNITVNQENKLRIGIKAGIGNRLDNNLQTINSYDLYLEQLLRGWTLGADIAYFPNDVLGFGAIFTDFKSKNSDNEILYRNEFTGAELIGSVTNNRSVKFIGPALFFRKKLDYKTYVVLGLSPGYNFYRDRGSYDGIDYTFTGGGFGAASTLGIDFLLGNDIIGRDIILSFESGYNYGKINALDYGDARNLVDLAQPLDVSRLDFTIGLRLIRLPKYFRPIVY